MTVDLAPAKVLLSVLCLLVTGFSLGQTKNTSHSPASPPPLTLQERVDGQMALERLAHSLRIWPEQNPGPKPSFNQTIQRWEISAKIQMQLSRVMAFENQRGQSFSLQELDQELERIRQNSKDPNTLRAMFKALGNDPTLLRELIAKPALVDRGRTLADHQEQLPTENASASASLKGKTERFPDEFLIPESMVQDGPKSRGLEPFLSDMPVPTAAGTWIEMKNIATRSPRAVWTGTEMIIWGGIKGNVTRDAIGRYNPSTDTWSTLSTGANSPLHRRDHSMVWTGTEAIVWGGNSWTGTGFAQQDSGGRYDPISNTWSSVAIDANTPSRRSRHTAVWTGSEMIIWGGAHGATHFQDGGRYDPTSDSWQTTSMGANLPISRSRHTAVWTGTTMIVWGGFHDGLAAYNSGGRYDPISDSWLAVSQSGAAPSPRIYHTSIWTGTEMIIWGGANNGLIHGDGSRYDPISDTWNQVSTNLAPDPRYYHQAVWTGSLMMIVGGSEQLGAKLYDPVSNSWSKLGLVTYAQRDFAAVWTGDEMIIWGGYRNGQYTLDHGFIINPSSNSLRRLGSPIGTPATRDSHTSIWTGYEMIIWGGSGWSGGRYIPAIDSWSPTSVGPGLPDWRSDHTAIWTGNEMIIWGGSGWKRDGGMYDPVFDTWVATSEGINVPAGRTDHSAIWTGSEMIIWGGTKNGSPRYRNSGGRFDPTTNSWQPTSLGTNVPPLRYRHTGIWTGSEMIIWGGRGASPKFKNDGGRYDPVSDTWETLSVGENVPLGRYQHTAVWTGSEMIVWGGYSNPGSIIRHNDGGRYDPSSDTWQATSLGPGVPEGRYFHTMVWNGSEVIIWGGNSYASGISTPLNTGGHYDPLLDTWAATTQSGPVPDRRFLHTATWTGYQMIIWGGLGIEQIEETRLNSGAFYISNSCLGTGPSISTTITADDIDNCADTGVNLSWILPSDWGDGSPLNRLIEVLRGGIAIANGGCSLLGPTETSCIDDSGQNDTTYQYSVRFTNSCLIMDETDPSPAADIGSLPAIGANNLAADLSMCEDTGIAVSWETPSDWGDSSPTGHSIQVLRDGTPLASGGCSGLSPSETNCVDNTGVNGINVLYSVRYTNTCNLQTTVAGTNAVDLVNGTIPLVIGVSNVLDPGFCLDTGLDLSWPLPSDWGDLSPEGRAIEILRDGIPISTGGCSGLTTTDTFCNDNTGSNNLAYQYDIRYTNTCTSQFTKAGGFAMDTALAPAPLLTGDSQNTCPTAQAQITTSGFDTYQWKEGTFDLPGEIFEDLSSWVTGTYFVSAFYACGVENSLPSDIQITGCNGGCGKGLFDEQGDDFSGWAPSSENSSGYGMITNGGFIQPVYGSAPPSNWYVSSYEKALNQTLGVNENVVFEVGMKSLNPDPAALGAVQVQWLDNSGNVAAETTWNSDISASSSNGYLWMVAEGNFFVNEVAGTTPVVNYSLRIERRGGLWTAYRNDVVLGTFTLAPTIEPTKVKLGFWKPDNSKITRAMQVDYITTGNTLASAVANSLTASVSSAGSTMDLTWTDTPDATSYNVYEDTNPAGTFATLSGNVPSGNPGLTIPMPVGDLMFFRIKAENACGEGQ